MPHYLTALMVVLWPALALSQTIVPPTSSKTTPVRPYIEPQLPARQTTALPLAESVPTAPIPNAIPAYPSNVTASDPLAEVVVPMTSAQDTPPVPQITSEAASKRMVVDLAIIDKNLARTQRLQIPMGRMVQYKTLEVMPERCVIDTAAKPRVQHALLVEMYDRKPQGASERLFAGWMLAGDPSLSHLAHPYYDVIVFSCTPQAEQAEAVEAEDGQKKKPRS